jgi:hypothetical protein
VAPTAPTAATSAALPHAVQISATASRFILTIGSLSVAIVDRTFPLVRGIVFHILCKRDERRDIGQNASAKE